MYNEDASVKSIQTFGRKELKQAVKYIVTRGLHRDSGRVQQEMEEINQALIISVGLAPALFLFGRETP